MERGLLEDFLIFIVLINPISKIVVLSGLKIINDFDKLKKIAFKAASTAFLVLILFAYGGTFFLRSIFHIEIYALQIAGGTVLFLVGLRALQKGEFFEIEHQKRFEDFAVVPIALPMIAGPATITASIAQSAFHGPFVTGTAILFANILNFFVMLGSGTIMKVLNKYNLVGALIRITGFFVASIGVNMCLTGIKEFLKSVQ
ncbi:MAG: MarC family protein [Candidatus Omnitrophica bacterium]|nr:MarC family protein [Candidatus Omnitrophota bacterium]